MPKKHSPTFVESETTLYAVNRAAKRLALRQGIKFQYVGLQPIRAFSSPVMKEARETYYDREIDGQTVEYTPYYQVKS